jgi:hypothetical protein
MADPAGTFRDGAMQFASQSSQINGVTYVFEKISVKHGQRRILQKDQNGVPSKKTHVVELSEGSATLQLPSATAPAPPRCAVAGLNALFSLVPIGGGAPVNFLVEDVSEVFDHENETKCEITFALQLSTAPAGNE